MINTIAWKTYFVFFCFNIVFIPIVYFFFPETNGYKLETLDAMFAEAHAKGQNPVFMEKSYRKTWKEGGERDLEKRVEQVAEDEAVAVAGVKGEEEANNERKEGDGENPPSESDEVQQKEQV